MLKHVFYLGLFLFSHGLFAWEKDTLYYDTGEIETIYKIFSYRKTYYKNGQLKHVTKYDKLWRKGRQITYDSLGNLTSKSKIFYLRTLHGLHKTYNKGELIAKTRYKYGIPEDSLKNDKGQKISCYISGSRAFPADSCSYYCNKYDIQIIPLMGCIAPRATWFKMRIHNSFIILKKTCRYGRRWLSEINDFCYGGP